MNVREYLTSVRDALERLDPAPLERVVDVLHGAYVGGRRVYVFGNGASAALAGHLAADLGKITAPALGEGPAAHGGRRLRTHSLSDTTAWTTALGNDVAYQDIFLEQLKNHLDPGDVAIGISGSGGSPNVLRALEYARNHGGVSVGFTGAMPKAELMRAVTDVLVQVPHEGIEQIEDLHVSVHHAVTLALVARIRERRAGEA